MESLIELIKEENFEHTILLGQFLIENSKLLEEFKKINTEKQNFFKLSVDDEKVYYISINIPSFDDFDIGIFKMNSEFFENNLKDLKIDFTNRTLFHFDNKKYLADPSLPIILEEKKEKIGKIRLNGIRVTFPDYKEFDSIILDVQPCSHCGDEALMAHVFLEEKASFSLSYLSELIRKSSNFIKYFVKERKNV